MKEVLTSRLFAKRILYTVCFIVLNAVDFVCSTQNGDISRTAANATGLALLFIIASQYPVRDLLTPLNYIWSGLCMAVIAAAVASGRDSIMHMYVWAFVMAVINVWWIFIYGKYLAVRFWRERKQAQDWWRRPGLTGWMWILMTALMTFSRSGRVWPIWFLAMFGMFYVTQYSEKDRNALMDGMVDGTIISFFMLQIFAYGFRPYDVVRYIGAFSNSNITALHYLLVYSMVLFKLHLLHQREAKKGWKLFYFVGACGLLGFMFLTMGRTAWVTAFLVTVLYGVFIVRQIWRKKWSAVLGRFLALGMTAVILFPAVFATVRWLPAVLHHPIWFLDEYSVDKVHSFDPPDSWKYIEIDEFLETVLGRIWRTFQISRARDPFLLVAQAAEEEEEIIELVGPEGMDRALNIRFSIYKTFLENLNLLGHSPQEGHYHIEDSDYMVWHAHNLWLQVAYYYGIPTGILFLAMTALLLKKHYRNMKTHTDNSYAVIPFFLCVLFFCYGTMEMVWNIGQMVLVSFFVIQHPQIVRSADEQCIESAVEAPAATGGRESA